jgi:hypothetical protein
MLVAFALVFTLGTLASAAARPASVEERQTRYEGRPLADVLRDMQRDGLRVVFSSELVRPEMRVSSEPKSKDARGRLDELLRPFGLGTQPGQNGTILVVRRSPVNGAAARTSPVAAPTGTVRGVVVDVASGAPLEGVVVQLLGSTLTVRTDAKGAFALEGVAAGRQTLYVSLVGYALVRPAVEVKPGESTEIRVALTGGTGTYNESLTVRADRDRGMDVTVPSEQRLGNAEIQNLRGVLADDPVRAVQSLPGVTASDDYRSEFSVRAADFQHTGVSIDGIAVPWPVHAVRGRDDTGSIAIINSDVLDHVTLSSAAYPQRAGSATGAWIDFGIRDGARSGFGLHGAVSATSASAVLEGPIAGGRGSWIASIRRSYLDWLLRALDFDENTAFSFLDHQSKVVLGLSDHHQLEVSAVAGRSGLDETEIDPGPNSIAKGDSHTAVVTAGVRSAWGNVALRQRVAFMSQGFHNTGDFGQVLGDGSWEGVGYQAELWFQPGRRVAVEAGGDVRHERETRVVREFGQTLPGILEPRLVDQFSGSSWRSSGYLHMLWTPSSQLAITPGVRVAHWTLSGETLASPWMQARWCFGYSALRAGAGVYQQFPLFEHVLGESGAPDLTRERAVHVDVAFERQLSDGLRWQATLYNRNERGMIRLENSEPTLSGTFGAPFYGNALNGSSRGVEFMIARSNLNGLSGWISYAYGHAKYDDTITGESFWGDFDQRHALTVYGQYRLSGRTNLSLKFRGGSNTPLPGYFVERDGALYLGDSRNDVRLPTYARLDLRADRTFHFTKRRLTLFVEVLNVLNRENLGPSDGFVRTRTNEAVGYVERLFPVLPAAGFLIEF